MDANEALDRIKRKAANEFNTTREAQYWREVYEALAPAPRELPDREGWWWHKTELWAVYKYGTHGLFSCKQIGWPYKEYLTPDVPNGRWLHCPPPASQDHAREAAEKIAADVMYVYRQSDDGRKTAYGEWCTGTIIDGAKLHVQSAIDAATVELQAEITRLQAELAGKGGGK